MSTSIDFLYKILPIQNWEESQNKEFLLLGEIDRTFIHFATKEQIPKVVEKFFRTIPYIILKVDPKRLIGRLVLEQNPGGCNYYFHLYEGKIPLSAILKTLSPLES